MSTFACSSKPSMWPSLTASVCSWLWAHSGRGHLMGSTTSYLTLSWFSHCWLVPTYITPSPIGCMERVDFKIHRHPAAATHPSTYFQILFFKMLWGRIHPVFLFFLQIYLFIYFWLRWVVVAVGRLSLVAASGGYSLLPCAGFSLRWLLLLRSTGSRAQAQ